PWLRLAPLDRFPDGGERKVHGERGAAVLAGALGTHRATVHLDQLANDPEPDAEAAMHPRGRAVGLAKGLEDMRQEALGDALARIRDRDAGGRLLRLQPHRHPAALRRELDRIRQEV